VRVRRSESACAFTTLLFVRDLISGGQDLMFTGQIILWLWFTVLFAW
jgi:K+-transporting ATPase ATPase B chain